MPGAAKPQPKKIFFRAQSSQRDLIRLKNPAVHPVERRGIAETVEGNVFPALVYAVFLQTGLPHEIPACGIFSRKGQAVQPGLFSLE
jgi:hypothetical protein